MVQVGHARDSSSGSNSEHWGHRVSLRNKFCVLRVLCVPLFVQRGVGGGAGAGAGAGRVAGAGGAGGAAGAGVARPRERFVGIGSPGRTSAMDPLNDSSSTRALPSPSASVKRFCRFSSSIFTGNVERNEPP